MRWLSYARHRNGSAALSIAWQCKGVERPSNAMRGSAEARLCTERRGAAMPSKGNATCAWQRQGLAVLGEAAATQGMAPRGKGETVPGPSMQRSGGEKHGSAQQSKGATVRGHAQQRHSMVMRSQGTAIYARRRN